MGTEFSGRKVLTIAVLLVSATVGAETWELRPAAGDVAGSAEIEAGRIDDAIRILMLELDSRASDTHLAVLENLCVAHTLRVEYDTAMRYCDQAAGHSSASATTLNNRGVLRAIMGDHHGAIQDFRRAGCLRSCGGGDCEGDSAQALARRNLARVKQREASSHHDAVLFQPRV
jgi:regulator of sirC expression with transglutaminase-like and TPR domain